jgi:hypothetical protein
MDRRAFLGLATVAAAFPAAIFGAEEGPPLPTSIPGYPQYKVLHFHFDAGVMPELTTKHGVQTVQVPTMCFDNTGRVCSMRMERELGIVGEHRVVPLSHPGAQRGLIENLQSMAKCLVDTHDDSKYVSLVTSKGSNGLVYQVGICATRWMPRRPSWPTWS